jgi:predicted MFS family arabinose efflux permease
VIVAAALAIFWSGIIIYPIGALVKPVAEASGWSRAQATSMMPFTALIYLLLGPLAGGLIDRIGVIRSTLWGLALLCVALLGVGLSPPNLYTWYGCWTLVAVAQLGCAVIPWTYAVAMTFERSRGLAMAVAFSSSGLAAAAMPLLTLLLLTRFGLAGSFLIYVVLIAGTSLPALAWLRSRGITLRPSSAGEGGGGAAGGLTPAQAIRTGTFWLLSFGMLALAGCQSSIIIHFQALLSDKGMRAPSAAWTASLFGPSMIAGRVVTGTLLDRLPARAMVAIVSAFPFLSCCILAAFDGSALFATLAILFAGVAAGAEGDMLAYFTSRYFGLSHYGVIYGLILGFFSIGWGGLPPLTGLIFDTTGSYQIAFAALAGLAFAGAVLLFSTGAYPQRFDDRLGDPAPPVPAPA